jgi:hypothetical protein
VLATLGATRGARGGREPVCAVAIAGLACLLASSQGRLWEPDGPMIWSPYAPLAEHVPLLSAVRVPAVMRMGVYLAAAMLAGIGLARLFRSRARIVALAASATVAAAVLAETFIDPIASRVYGRAQNVTLRSVRPSDAALSAYRAFEDAGVGGPVVDMPYFIPWGHFGSMPRYTLLAAYHRREIAACFNSYLPPTYDNNARLVERFVAAADPDELVAAGMRNVVWHDREGMAVPASLLSAAGVSKLWSGDGFTALRLTSTSPVHHDRHRLRPGRLSAWEPLQVGGFDQQLRLEVLNDAPATFSLEKPIAPEHATLSWTRQDHPTLTYEVAILLPLALAPGKVDPLAIHVSPPPPGVYRVELAVPSLGWHIIGDSPVTVN